VLARDMHILVVAGGARDRDIFHSLGFTDVTITNLGDDGSDLAPYRWESQDAEALTYSDDSFDWGFVNAGLHHCRSPHTALLELYRVARHGLLAIEARDNVLVRAAMRLGVIDEYERTAVADHQFLTGGVRNTPVPNYVYRWTEREVVKTISSAAPYARHEFMWFHELEWPLSIFEVSGRKWTGRVLKALHSPARFAVKLAPRQANLLAFAVLMPTLPRDLQPWLRASETGVVPGKDAAPERYGS